MNTSMLLLLITIMGVALLVWIGIAVRLLKEIKILLSSLLQTQDKIFRLIRYKRSQELVDFLTKRVEHHGPENREV